MYRHQNTSTVQPITQASPITIFSAKLDLLNKYNIVRSFRQLLAENTKQLFCTAVCSLMMCQCGPKHVGAGVLQYYDFNQIVCIGWFEL